MAGLCGTFMTIQVRLLWVKPSNSLRVVTFPLSVIVLYTNTQMVPVPKEQG